MHGIHVSQGQLFKHHLLYSDFSQKWHHRLRIESSGACQKCTFFRLFIKKQTWATSDGVNITLSNSRVGLVLLILQKEPCHLGGEGAGGQEWRPNSANKWRSQLDASLLSPDWNLLKCRSNRVMVLKEKACSENLIFTWNGIGGAS